MAAEKKTYIDIKPLLTGLWHESSHVSPSAIDIAAAIALIFTNDLSDVQTGALLTALHFTDRDREADVLTKCAESMRNAALPTDMEALKTVIDWRGRHEGTYHGGLCDIVGTGGDSHNTFNISTTSSILASSLLLIAKHGNVASTSKSGSANLLENAMPLAPKIRNVTPATLTNIYSATNYSFLFAQVFHPGAKHAADIRRQLGWRTIFNLLGPLANPLHPLVETRVIGVARREIGPVFAESLRQSGAKKALIICGDEELDELSCAGPTHCWQLAVPSGASEPEIASFTLTPEDFGLPRHPLSEVSPGKEPAENAAILMSILKGERPQDDPIVHFVLINTAALFVVSGICEAESSNMGPGDDGKVITERGPAGGRWKEGVRRARWAISSGAALKEWEGFVEVTNRG
ncbi:anthranilate phosphoribosyltransferase [Mytilinidion resinicola]|uniref:Anthranilate phosphoribosyltransferase n=1 Tax=Mytilinidion resinicola TaxID=574789 RepID=A0A6A6YXN7_9PEZI|nr:anthranilate phosphoribosyltransferase [Mytilinidion resinicola]KAF2813550.1 anthranilate phosphoribosyltransferase [Mytilinidion resinicola]